MTTYIEGITELLNNPNLDNKKLDIPLDFWLKQKILTDETMNAINDIYSKDHKIEVSIYRRNHYLYLIEIRRIKEKLYENEIMIDKIVSIKELHLEAIKNNGIIKEGIYYLPKEERTTKCKLCNTHFFKQLNYLLHMERKTHKNKLKIS